MSNFENINVTSNVRRIFEKSMIISDMFNDEIIRSAYVMMSIFSDQEALINKYFQETGLIVVPEMIIYSLLYSKENFADVFGKEAAEKCFKEDEKEESDTNTVTEASDLEKETKETQIEETTLDEGEEPSDELKDKVMQVLSEILVPISGEQEMDVNIEIKYSDKLLEACEDASTRCLIAKQDFLDVDNLLFSILKNENSSAYKMVKLILDSLEIGMDDVIEFIEQNGNIYTIASSKNNIILPKKLENCCTILNDKYTMGQECDILGREKEIFKLWSVFSKRTKRNSVLIGEAGVGKTAIVEAMVQEIVNEKSPKEFLGYTVIELDVGAAIAGTKYRGEFEEKVNQLKKFLEKTPDVILFIDEMHQMMGAGSAEGSGVDLSGALKPILSRNDVIFIGSTTLDEYNKYLTRDLAFKRRFEQVIVKEPRYKEVKPMVKARIKNLSKYHGISIKDSLIDYVIICAIAFNRVGHNPDITLDLCDRSMAIAKMRNSKTLEKRDVDKVNEESYEAFEKFPEIKKKSTAYHEAAHYVISMETSRKEMENPVLITIVPSKDFLGGYIYENKESFGNLTQQNYVDYIYSLLAGRAAQKHFLNEAWDDGATSDIEKATEIAKKMITKFSLVKYSDSNLPISFDDDYKYISDTRKEMITKKAEEIVSNAYTHVNNLMYSKNIKEKIIKVAELLLEKKIVTAEQLEKCIK